jgi:hypothetical protein
MSIWMQQILREEREKLHHETVAAIESMMSADENFSLYGIRPHRQMTQSEYDENKRAIEAWLNTPQAKALLAKNILEISLESCTEGFTEAIDKANTERAERNLRDGQAYRLAVEAVEAPSGVEPKLQPQELNTGLVREEPAG